METDAKPDRSAEEEPPSELSEEMAAADVANGERPEQPVSEAHSVYERQRTDHHPVGEPQAETNCAEESPA